MSGWPTEHAWLALAVCAGASLGALAGNLWAGAFFGLLGLVLWRLRDLHRMQDWLPQSLGRPPHLRGATAGIAELVWSQRRADRLRMQRLARIAHQLRSATHALPDAAVLLDARDMILWFNGAAARLLRLEQRDLGRSLPSLLRSPEIRALLANRDRLMQGELLSPVNDLSTLDVRLIPNTDGRRLLLAQDVTQITRLRQMRQDFIANVSHELRTPLTVIIGYLEALEGETDPTFLHQTLGRLQRPAARMRNLVENLMLLSRLDSAPPPDTEALAAIDVATLLQRICTDAEALPGASHVFELAVDESVLLRGLEAELHSAFSNLIINAVRYSPQGGQIRVSWQHRDGGACFSVEDEGLGIAEEHIERLTERFYRVDAGRSREAGGTGLGLAIVKHVLRRHGSTLEIRSSPGQGSIFSCQFGPERITHQGAVYKDNAAAILS